MDAAAYGSFVNSAIMQVWNLIYMYPLLRENLSINRLVVLGSTFDINWFNKQGGLQYLAGF